MRRNLETTDEFVNDQANRFVDFTKEYENVEKFKEHPAWQAMKSKGNNQYLHPLLDKGWDSKVTMGCVYENSWDKYLDTTLTLMLVPGVDYDYMRSWLKSKDAPKWAANGKSYSFISKLKNSGSYDEYFAFTLVAKSADCEGKKGLQNIILRRKIQVSHIKSEKLNVWTVIGYNYPGDSIKAPLGKSIDINTEKSGDATVEDEEIKDFNLWTIKDQFIHLAAEIEDEGLKKKTMTLLQDI